jgi:hypothetical protein
MDKGLILEKFSAGLSIPEVKSKVGRSRVVRGSQGNIRRRAI